MSQTLHALIVGIDKYKSSDVKDLRRSVVFAYEMQNFLEKKLKPGVQLKKELLVDHQATRNNIIARLQFMAREAGNNDTCLFYFIGHGSQEIVPPELCGTMDEDDLIETIICHDSRYGGQKELADKEIVFLINEVHRGKTIHFTTIMDCCHSGDNNRKNATMEGISGIDPLEKLRSPHEFLGHHSFGSIDTHSNSIGLAACLPDELAKNGLFSEFLMKTLKEHHLPLSYHQIVAQFKQHLSNRGQTPGIYPPKSPLRYTPFLNGFLQN